MINLLPYQEKKMIEHVRILRVVNVTLGIIIFLIIAAVLLLLPTLMTIDSRYGLAQEQIALLEKEGVVTSSVDIQSLDTRATELVNKLAAPGERMPTSYISIVGSTVTPSITLIGFTFKDQETPSLSISGIAKTREALQAYVVTLEAKKEIEKVDSPITNYVKSKDADFAITVTFKK